MDEGLARITRLAWRTVPAREANPAISRARRATFAGEEAARRGEAGGAPVPGNGGSGGEKVPGEDAPMARAYEMVLEPGATFERFAREQLPRLVYHLESIGAHLPRAPGVVVCIFEGENLHFLQASELIGEACAQLGVAPEELARRHGTGESRSAQRGPPLGLPPTGGEPA